MEVYFNETARNTDLNSPSNSLLPPKRLIKPWRGWCTAKAGSSAGCDAPAIEDNGYIGGVIQEDYAPAYFIEISQRSNRRGRPESVPANPARRSSDLVLAGLYTGAGWKWCTTGRGRQLNTVTQAPAAVDDRWAPRRRYRRPHAGG